MFMGFVQGVAEFLPISSSGHLTLLQYFFGMKEVDNLFNILLHFATLLAVCVVYWKDIVEMVVEFFRGFASLFSGHGSRESRPPTARRLVLMVIVGTLPLFVVLPLEGVVEQLGNYPAAVSVMLILTGFILFFSDRMGGGRKNASAAEPLPAARPHRHREGRSVGGHCPGGGYHPRHLSFRQHHFRRYASGL